ncbi:MAG TPA: hypothetical protein V6C91_13165 [Coleofasciculaceae cyanobacterium]
MVSNKDSELPPAGSELFQDSESFLDELSDDWEMAAVEVTNIIASNIISFASCRISCVTDSGFMLSPSTANEGISELNVVSV